MFCLHFVSLCLLLVVGLDLSSGVHLNVANIGKFVMLENSTESDFEYMKIENDFVETIGENTLKKFANVRIFYLISNPLAVIPENLFKYNTNLRIIHIMRNQIATLHPETFAAQMGLVELFLNNNYLTEIDKDLFRHNTNLTQLNLGHNRITEIKPNTFTTLVNLKIIKLEDNRLTSLPENLFAHNTKLVRIFLNRNRFKVLPATLVQNNAKLNIFCLHNNRLQSFDVDNFRANPQMFTIRLHNNDLTEIVSYDEMKQIWPKFSNISLTGNNFRCSYMQSIYDYCNENGINLFVNKEDSTKYPEDHSISGHSCIEDKDFEVVSAARINAPDAPFKDVTAFYPIPLNDGRNKVVVGNFFGANYRNVEMEQSVHNQKECEDLDASSLHSLRPRDYCYFLNPY